MNDLIDVVTYGLGEHLSSLLHAGFRGSGQRIVHQRSGRGSRRGIAEYYSLCTIAYPGEMELPEKIIPSQPVYP